MFDTYFKGEASIAAKPVSRPETQARAKSYVPLANAATHGAMAHSRYSMGPRVRGDDVFRVLFG